jgi:hypothetical protein
VLCTLVAATIYETLVALGAIELGSVPGEGPAGEGLVLFIALVAMLAGAGLVAFRPLAPFAPIVAPSAAAFLVARFYTFDPYYLPALRRMSDGGLVSPVLVFAVAALALCAAAITSARPQAGRFIAAPVILVCAFLALVVDGGH